MLMHYDYPEAWHLNGNATFSSTGMKFGKGCAYFPDAQSNISITNSTGMFNLNPFGNYELEAFVKLKDSASETEANIFGIDDLTLTERPRTITDYYAEQGYSFFGSHTFKYFDTPLTWTEAKVACEELGGHLATSTSAEKNTFLYGLIDKSNAAWLGGSDEETEGTWKWVTGETWDYTNWSSGEPDNAHGGQDYLCFNWSKTSGALWWDSGKQSDGSVDALPYICEWDYDMREQHSLSDLDPESINTKILSLSSTAWGLSSTCDVQMLPHVWYHVLLRVSDEAISVFIDGVAVLKAYIDSSTTITPETVQLGGYVGYMDEFAFRRNAGSEAPTVPISAYETGTTATTQTQGAGNAPVSRVAWYCDNLPDGLTLSGLGILSGKPTTAGTYECDVSVTTNWGTTTKTVTIKVE